MVISELATDAKQKIEASPAWRNESATESQLAFLRRHGVVHAKDITKGQASDVISSLCKPRRYRW